jgi:hypothetical protein
VVVADKVKKRRSCVDGLYNVACILILLWVAAASAVDDANVVADRKPPKIPRLLSLRLLNPFEPIDFLIELTFRDVDNQTSEAGG